jgi:hypothetical protein
MSGPNGRNEEYQKSLEDELDWSLLEQLHKVVLQISSFCFHTKQICLTVDVAVVGLLIKFTENRLDTSIFVAALLIPLCFWFLDAVAYFYQVKIRGIMDGIRDRLRKRNSPTLVLADVQRTIAQKRTTGSAGKRLLAAFVNHSMWFYAFLIVTDVVLWILWCRGAFQI